MASFVGNNNITPTNVTSAMMLYAADYKSWDADKKKILKNI